MTGTAARLAELSPERLALLLKKLGSREVASNDEIATLAEIQRREGCVLSFAQQRLWFLSQMDPESASYNCHTSVRVEGRLDRKVLIRTLAALVARHETLRTVFTEIDGEPRQKVLAAEAPRLPAVELSTVPNAPRTAEMLRLIVAEQQRPFDLVRGPLLRCIAVRLASHEHVLLVTMHHIVSDGWSMGVLVGDFAEIYRALCAGQVADLPKLPIQYADFAAWERRTLAGVSLERHLAWWRQTLEGAPSRLVLPTDRQRRQGPARASYLPFMLDRSMPQELAVLSKAESTTLFMTLLAGFSVFLGWFAGTDDLVVGSPIANRSRPELESLIGFFVNALALRTRLAPEQTFRELLGRTRGVCYGAYEHQELPFEKLVEVLQPVRVPEVHPLFQVTFTLQNAPRRGVDLLDLKMSTIDSEVGAVKFDLMLDVWEGTEALDAVFTYNAEIFYPSTIERFARLYRELLIQAVARPDATISTLREVLSRLDGEIRTEQELGFRQGHTERLRTTRRRMVSA